MAESAHITVRLPASLRAALDKRMSKRGESQSTIVLAALAEYLGVTVATPVVGRPAVVKVDG